MVASDIEIAILYMEHRYGVGLRYSSCFDGGTLFYPVIGAPKLKVTKEWIDTHTEDDLELKLEEFFVGGKSNESKPKTSNPWVDEWISKNV